MKMRMQHVKINNGSVGEYNGRHETCAQRLSQMWSESMHKMSLHTPSSANSRCSQRENLSCSTWNKLEKNYPSTTRRQSLRRHCVQKPKSICPLFRSCRDSLCSSGLLQHYLRPCKAHPVQPLLQRHGVALQMLRGRPLRIVKIPHENQTLADVQQFEASLVKRCSSLLANCCLHS